MKNYSLADIDFYKLSMCQVFLNKFSNVDAEYTFVCRSKVDLRPYKKRIEEEIDKLCKSRFSKEELNFIRTIRFIKPGFVDFLEDFTLKRRYIEVIEKENQIAFKIKGPLVQTMWFETHALSIVAEIYGEAQGDKDAVMAEGRRRLQEKVKYFKSLEEPFYFTEFGTRRRYSQEWQNEVIQVLKKECGQYLLGTSNVHFAMKHGLNISGTMAHEFLMLAQGLKETQLVNSQKYMLQAWADEYRGDLGIALTDTIGIDAFKKDFDTYFAKLYDGIRHDSGSPYAWGDAMIDHYKSMNIDPMTKNFLFSDNLNFESANHINQYFKGRCKKFFGIGTFLTNDMGFKALSIVIKLSRVNGNAVAKLSDEPSKEICEDSDFMSYLKKVFNKK